MEEKRRYLVEFFGMCNFGKEPTEELLMAFDKIALNDGWAESFLEIVSRYDGEDVNINYENVDKSATEIADASGIHKYTVILLVYAAMTKRLRERYIERGIDLEIFKKSMMDFKYKLDECMLVKGVVGNFVSGWESGFLKLRLFGLGRLQYEIVPLGENITLDGVELTADSPAINIHIPRSGEPFDRESVLASYRMAKEFFADTFDGKSTLFVCSSWLLWREHLNMLKEGSNIRAFIGDFTIIKEKTYPDYAEVWRLFDVEYGGNPDHLPADSSLRRKYIEHIKSGKPTGSSKGVFFLD